LLGRRYLLDRAIATVREHGDRMRIMRGPFHINRIMDAMVRDVRPDILVIDYLQRIECCEGIADTRVRVNQLMNTFRQIADAGVCVVLVSAVGRPSTKKGGGYNSKELGLASLRESSEIEYGCDDVYVMVAEEQSGPRNGDGRRTLLLKHEKSRNHSQQDLRFEFEGAVQRFYLLPPLDDLGGNSGASDGSEGGDHGDGGGPSGSPSPARASVWTPQPGQPRLLPPPGDTLAHDVLENNL
jgi:replicative DNA helicase